LEKKIKTMDNKIKMLTVKKGNKNSNRILIIIRNLGIRFHFDLTNNLSFLPQWVGPLAGLGRVAMDSKNHGFKDIGTLYIAFGAFSYG
jgi:hypothetical protein